MIVLDGDKINKKERKGGSGFELADTEVCYTLTAKDVHCVLAFDGYNFTLSDVAPSIGVNCGMSTGRGGYRYEILITPPYAD